MDRRESKCCVIPDETQLLAMQEAVLDIKNALQSLYPAPEKLRNTPSVLPQWVALSMFAAHTLVKHQIKCDLSFI